MTDPHPQLTPTPQPDPKTAKKTFTTLQQHLSYLHRKSADKTRGGDTEFVGEYQTLMEQEFFDFVLFEVPWIVI